MIAFGQELRRLRLRAGLGLRTFASLVDERPSTINAIEHGLRGPWRIDSKLQQAAGVLGLEPDSPQLELLSDLARPAARSPVDSATNSPGDKVLVPLLVSRADGASLGETEVRHLLLHLAATTAADTATRQDAPWPPA